MNNDFDIFYEAAKLLIHGQSPYSVYGFFNPVWALIPFIPLTFFPVEIASRLYTLETLLGVMLGLKLLHLKPLMVVIVVLFTPLVWLSIFNPNVDWLVILGLGLPFPFNAALLVVKPQMAMGVYLLWLFERRWRLLIFSGGVLALNYVIFGLPIMKPFVVPYNDANVFPFGLPIGLLLVAAAMYTKRKEFALDAGGFLSPYYGVTSWLSIAPSARSLKSFLVVMCVSWAVHLIWRSSL